MQNSNVSKTIHVCHLRSMVTKKSYLLLQTDATKQYFDLVIDPLYWVAVFYKKVKDLSYQKLLILSTK